jgi:hypothetical protein
MVQLASSRRRPRCASIPAQPAAGLPQLVDVGRDVTSLEAGQIHVGHLSGWVEQKCHHTRFAEIAPSGDLLEGWRIGGGLALVEAHHMARGAPPLRQPLAVGSVGGERGSDNDRDENSKGGGNGKRRPLNDGGIGGVGLFMSWSTIALSSRVFANGVRRIGCDGFGSA